MSITLYYHPFSRAATAVWMLEELGLEHELRFVDLFKAEHKEPWFRAINPMGKLPALVDGAVTLTEVAAIGMYLADRYSSGVLAPALTDPARATYLRWILFAPSVIEPGALAESAKWEFRPSSAGWGSYAEMLDTMETAIGAGPWLLGEQFSMADVIFGGTVRYLLQFKMLEARPAFVAYVDRLNARPAAQRAAARNQAMVAERGLGR